MGCCSSRCCRKKRSLLRGGVVVPSGFRGAEVGGGAGRTRPKQSTDERPRRTEEGGEKPTKAGDTDARNNNRDEASKTQKHFFFGTRISLEWLLEQLALKFQCQFTQQPQWIIERLNQYTEKDIDRTMVLRITFGWEHELLPKSVVLKISTKENSQETPYERLAARMYKKECLAYEWLLKVKKARIPKVLVIRKASTEDGEEPVIVMEDLSERARGLDLADHISVELVRELLRQLALIHAASWLRRPEWTPLIQENPVLFYKEMSEFVRNAAQSWTTLGEERVQKLLDLSAPDAMTRTVHDACTALGTESCLVHGNPVARNFFAGPDGRSVAALVDWTQVHPGCFGEDVAKAICWNLTPKERHVHQRKLLEHYHFNLLRYSDGQAKDVTLETVERAFRWFLPLSAVCYLMYLPDQLQRADIKLLERAQALIDESLAQEAGLPPSAPVLQQDAPQDLNYGDQDEPKPTLPAAPPQPGPADQPKGQVSTPTAHTSPRASDPDQQLGQLDDQEQKHEPVVEPEKAVNVDADPLEETAENEVNSVEEHGQQQAEQGSANEVGTVEHRDDDILNDNTTSESEPASDRDTPDNDQGAQKVADGPLTVPMEVDAPPESTTIPSVDSETPPTVEKTEPTETTEPPSEATITT